MNLLIIQDIFTTKEHEISLILAIYEFYIKKNWKKVLGHVFVSNLKAAKRAVTRTLIRKYSRYSYTRVLPV